MDSVRFNALVHELETLSRRRPAALRARVRLWVALGYAYVFVILAVLFAVLGVSGWLILNGKGVAFAVKLAIAPLILTFIVLKGLWVRFDPPDGRVLTRKDAPKLFQRVEQIRRKLKSPPADVVLLTRDFNAAVSQIPRLGIFGWERTYLVIGLPLMYAVAPKHLDAVLAHEFGHVSGAHPKFGLWVGRVGRTFGRIVSQFQQRNWLTEITFGRFFGWYVPRLNAHAFALSRNDEYAADRDSAEVSGARASGEALASIEVRGRRYGEFWEALGRRVEHEPEAPATTWTGIPGWIREGDALAERATWFDEAMSREGLVDETHPALRARLRALKVIGERPAASDVLLAQFVPPLTTTAAEFYLGTHAAAQLRAWETEWLAENREEWRVRHRALTEERAKLDAILARDLAGESLAPDELWKAAVGVVQLDGDVAALPWLERAAAADPANGGAQFLLGRALLANRDGRGVAHVERAMSLDVQSVPAATELLRQYHASLGDRAAAVATEIASDAHYERLAKTNEERSGVTPKDTLVAPTLSVADRAAFLEAVKVEGVKRLWIARKVTTQQPDRPLLVVIVEAKQPLLLPFGGRGERLARGVWDLIGVDETRDILLITEQDGLGWLFKKLRQAGGLVVDAKRGTISAKPFRWHERHRRALWVGAIGAGVVALAAWLLVAPGRLADPHGIVAPQARAGWDDYLNQIRWETKADVRVLFDSGSSPADFERRLREHATAVSLGESQEGRGVLIGVNLTSGTLDLVPMPALSPFLPSAFAGELAAAVRAAGASGSDLIRPAMSATVAVHQRLREVSLTPRVRFTPLPRPDSIAIVRDSVVTTVVPTWTPLRLDAPRDTVLEAHFAPGATAEEAFARYQAWLALGVYVPRARVLSRVSRAFFAGEFPMTAVHWDVLRRRYAMRPLRVVARGDVAVAYSTEDPLVSPIYFRRTREGWQLDVQAELDHTEELVEADGFTWRLVRTGGPYDTAFADLMVQFDGAYWRFRDGANTRLDSCGCGDR